MKRVFAVLVSLGMAVALGAPVARAYQSDSARWSDVRRLQDDLSALEDSLATVPANHPRYRDLQRRADDLHQDLVSLRDGMRHDRDSSDSGVPLADVDRVRERIRTLQSDVDAALDRRWAGAGRIAVPEGSEITVRLNQSLSSRTARVEDRFDASVARPVLVGGRVIVRTGARVQGTVTQAESAQGRGRGGRLNLAFDRLFLEDGSTVTLNSRLVRVRDDLGSNDTARRGGIGAALGAVLGGVLGGGKGVLVGALLGGAGGAITSNGDDVYLPEGTVFTLQLEGPATIERR
ncbi:MAG TPA: hypothetical protein VGQ33_03585 [Vicinamibacteria bacterium]|nr:hypothetical protein [Vicinamibacteria bacterium]